MKLQPTISKTIFYSFLFAIGGSPTLAMLIIYGLLLGKMKQLLRYRMQFVVHVPVCLTRIVLADHSCS